MELKKLVFSAAKLPTLLQTFLVDITNSNIGFKTLVIYYFTDKLHYGDR